MKATDLKLRREYFYFDWHTRSVFKVKYVSSCRPASYQGRQRRAPCAASCRWCKEYLYRFRFVDGTYLALYQYQVKTDIFDNHFDCVMAAAGRIIKKNIE